MPIVPIFIPLERFSRLRHPKLVIIGFVLGMLLLILVLPPVYQESWLDPFNTLNVPNKVLHPLSFSQIGLMDPADPFNPHFFADHQKVKELMKDLQHATLVPSNQTQVQKDEKILYFTLHRKATRYHAAADFSLQYNPKRNIVYFGEQQFMIDNVTTLLLNDISQKMQPGWWN
ncbi:MAG: hypothetical protein ACYDEJ_09405 [Desulfitobacteriaceae bacterium]